MMQIFDISHLFATPVLAAATANTQSTKSKRRRRKRTQLASCVYSANVCSNGGGQHSSVNSSSRVAGNREVLANSAVHKQSRKFKKETKSNSGLEPGATEGKPSGGAVKTIPESDQQQMTELVNSLQTLTSEKIELEKNLNELREENDRLIRNNEDLKDELKEMTDEALELTVEKQRLLSKVGALKKQLLNRPK